VSPIGRRWPISQRNPGQTPPDGATGIHQREPHQSQLGPTSHTTEATIPGWTHRHGAWKEVEASRERNRWSASTEPGLADRHVRQPEALEDKNTNAIHRGTHGISLKHGTRCLAQARSRWWKSALQRAGPKGHISFQHWREYKALPSEADLRGGLQKRDAEHERSTSDLRRAKATERNQTQRQHGPGLIAKSRIPPEGCARGRGASRSQ